MSLEFEILDGLPSSGPMPRWVPESWRRTGQEGFVVRFLPEGGAPWVGNFRPWVTSCFEVFPHPSGEGLLVFAGGNTYLVSNDGRSVNMKNHLSASTVWPVARSRDLLLEKSGIAFLRLGPGGVVWHSRRISWDGFRNLELRGDQLRGEAWSAITDSYVNFTVDLVTGRTEGGPDDVPPSYEEILHESPPESS